MWGPVTKPTGRALASWLCALWGRHEGAGGAPLAWVWGVRGWALSHPRLPALWAGCRGPLPTGCGCGGVRAWGPVTSPTSHALASWLCALWGRHEGPRGGNASCLGVGRPGSGALQPLTARPLGGLPGPTTHWLWVWGGARVGTRHQPHSTRSCELALQAVGAAWGCPGGAPLAWVWGIRGRALSHPRLPALWAGCRGPLSTGCGCGGVRAWGPVTNPTARALASWLCALWGRHEGAWGGAHSAWVWGVRGRALSHPRLPALRAGCRGPLPTGCRCGGVRAWGPVTNPTARALASWLCALWGRHEGARGGRLLPGCGASGVGRSPTPDCPPSWRAARAHYPLAVGARGCGPGDPSSAPQRALLRACFARCGGGMRVPGEGASCLGVGRLGSGALPTPTARPLGGLPGPTTHWLLVLGGCGRGDHSPTPQRALLRAGFARCGGGTKVGGEGRLLPGCGVSAVGRSPTPDCPPSGRAAGAHYPLAVGAGGCGRGDPSQTPQRALLRAGFARCGGGMRVPGGAPLAWMWGVRGRALSHPRLPALWAGCRGPLPTGCGCGGVPAWGAVTKPAARALSSWLCALWGRHEGARGGGASCLGVGCPGSGALPPPTARPLGGLPGPTTHWLWERGGAGLGTRHQPHSARFCELALRAVGATLGCLGGGASCPGVGGPESGAPSPLTARPLGGLPGPTTHWLWVRGGEGVGTRHQPHRGRSCELALRAVGAARGRLGGGRLLLGCGGSGVGRSLTPDCPPSGRAAGAHYPLAVGAGGCGRGDPSQTPQRALLRAGFARCGGGMRVPGGAPLAWMWGVRGRALSHPRLPALWAGCRGPLPTGCGCGGVPAWGAVTKPAARALSSWLCALWGRHEGARGGGASCLGVGCPGSGALPPPTARPLGGLPGPTTHWLWERGGAGLGTRHQPHSARFCELALRAVGATLGCLGGGASCPGVGGPESGAPSPLTARPLGGLPGPTTHWLWVRGGEGVGTRHQPHRGRSCELALRAVGAARGRLGGGRLLLGCGGSGVGRSLTPDCPPSGRAAGPTTHWLWVRGAAGVGTRHQPLSARSCELALHAVGAAWGCPGGRRLPGCGASGVGCSPTPDCPPSGRAAGAHYRLAVGAGGCRRGDPSPTPQRALFRAGFGRCGGGTRAPSGARLLPGCGASVVGRSPTPDCPPSGRAAGAHYPLVVGAGGCGRRDPSQTPQRALLRAGFARCGSGMRVPGGAPLAWVWGVRGRALSPPRLPALWAGCRGPLPTGCGCGGVRAWGPVTSPTARALASLLCALWGRHEGAWGGAPPARVGGVWGRALSHPRLPALWAGCWGPLPIGSGCGGVRACGPVTNPTARALASWLCALWGQHEGAWRGGASCSGVGGPGSGALSPPTARPLGGLPGPTTHWLWVRGGAGVWTRHQPHSARSCELALRAVGAARGRVEGGRLLLGCGGSGVGRSLTPDWPPSGRAAGAHYPLALGAGGCGRGDPSPTPQRTLLRAGFARCGGGTRAPGGGRLLPWCGASGVGRSPTPDCPPSGRAAGAHYPLAVGAGGCGRGDLSQTPQRALLRAGFARCGGGMRVPGGAPLAWMWGVRGRALSHPRLPALWAGCRGPLPTGCGSGGVRAWGPVTSPTARAFASLLCALWGPH